MYANAIQITDMVEAGFANLRDMLTKSQSNMILKFLAEFLGDTS